MFLSEAERNIKRDITGTVYVFSVEPEARQFSVS